MANKATCTEPTVWAVVSAQGERLFPYAWFTTRAGAEQAIDGREDLRVRAGDMLYGEPYLRAYLDR